MIETAFNRTWVWEGLKKEASVGITVVEHLPHYHMVSGSRPAELTMPQRIKYKNILKEWYFCYFKKKFINIFLFIDRYCIFLYFYGVTFFTITVSVWEYQSIVNLVFGSIYPVMI
jgi:hypothetical protein